MAPAMEELVIDLSNYKDRDGARVPEGDYTVVVEDVERAVSKAGNKMINTWLRIVGGDYDGQVIIDRITISEAAAFRVVGFLKAIGAPYIKGKTKLVPESWVGRPLRVHVADGAPYADRIKSEVKQYEALPKSAQVGSAGEASDFSEFEGLSEAVADITTPVGNSEIADLPEAVETVNVTSAEAPSEPAPVSEPEPAADTITLDEDDDSVNLDSVDL